MNKYYINQHVFVFEHFECRAIECIMKNVNNGVYGIEPIENIGKLIYRYGREIYETKEQCLKSEYETAKLCIQENVKKMKKLKEQLNDEQAVVELKLMNEWLDEYLQILKKEN